RYQPRGDPPAREDRARSQPTHRLRHGEAEGTTAPPLHRAQLEGAVARLVSPQGEGEEGRSVQVQGQGLGRRVDAHRDAARWRGPARAVEGYAEVQEPQGPARQVRAQGEGGPGEEHLRALIGPIAVD